MFYPACGLQVTNLYQGSPFEDVSGSLVQFSNLTRLFLIEGINWSNEGAQLLGTMSRLHSLEDLNMKINITSTSTVRGSITVFSLKTDALTEELYTNWPEEPQISGYLLLLSKERRQITISLRASRVSGRFSWSIPPPPSEAKFTL
jgi:hypothetical protein